MPANYHTHTTRCNHAEGTEEEYVERALEGGFSILGFSDHAPYLFDEPHISGYRMMPAEYNGYIDAIEALRDKYRDKIEILIGLEIEYYPSCFEETLKFILSRDIDYLILGQHYTKNEYDGEYVSHPTLDEDILITDYASQVELAIKTGLFTYVAHPDIPLYTKPSQHYEDEMSKICMAANEAGIPLEINLCGLSRGRHYPSERFLALASDLGCDMIIGFDAHSPEELYSKKAVMLYEKAVAAAKKYNLHISEKAELIKPRLSGITGA